MALASWVVSSAVRSIEIFHDGTRIVSGSNDGHVCVWDVHTGSLVLGPLRGHTRRVGSVAISPDDNLIASGSDDDTIRIWDTRTGSPVGDTLKGHARAVCSVAFSPDSTRIVSGSHDSSLRIWDTSTGHPLGEPLRGHTNVVSSVAFSPDSTCIISGSWDCTIRIWDAQTGAPLHGPLLGHTRSVYSVAFSPNNARIASGSWDYTVRIWDANTGAPTGTPLKGHTGSVASIAFSPDSTCVVSGSFDNTIRTWNVRTGAAVGEVLKGHTSVVYSVKYLSDSTRIVSGSLDRTIRVWKAQHIQMIDAVTSDTSISQIVDMLVTHGCTDLTASTDLASCSRAPVNGGGWGDLYKGHMKNGLTVAIKCPRLFLRPQDATQLLEDATHELYVWSKLHHENVQELLGVVMCQGQLGMASLWMENGHVMEYLERNPNVDRYSLCLQLVHGVSYLHSVKMVHGDIKGQNLLVSDEGIIKITDFGDSLLLDSSPKFSTLRKQNTVALNWAAPELLIDADTVRTLESDIYSLGMTMLEIFTDEPPYGRSTTPAAIIVVLLSTHQRPSRPKPLEFGVKQNKIWELIVRCWAEDPKGRPDALSVLKSLKSFVN